MVVLYEVRNPLISTIDRDVSGSISSRIWLQHYDIALYWHISHGRYFFEAFLQ